MCVCVYMYVYYGDIIHRDRVTSYFVISCIIYVSFFKKSNFSLYYVTTVVWEKFDVKKFSSLVWHDENWTHEIFLTMNKKVTLLFIGDSKGRKYFTMNKFHTKISNGVFFPNYGSYFSQKSAYVWYIPRVNNRLERVSNFTIPSEKWARKVIPDITVILCKCVSCWLVRIDSCGRLEFSSHGPHCIQRWMEHLQDMYLFLFKLKKLWQTMKFYFIIVVMARVTAWTVTWTGQRQSLELKKALKVESIRRAMDKRVHQGMNVSIKRIFNCFIVKCARWEPDALQNFVLRIL